MIKKYEQYIDSKVDWINKIPKDWEIVKFKRIAKIRNGKDQKSVLEEDGKYPILGTGGEFGRANQFLYNKPSVLLGRKGTIDKPQYIDVPFWTVDTLFYTEILEKNSPKYLFYFSKVFPYTLLQESSAVPSMTQAKLHNLTLCRPSYDEQTKIGKYLDHQTGLIDAIIEKKKLLIEKLKEQRQAIINEAVTKGLDSNVQMKDNGVECLGEIPDHWEIKKIKHIAKAYGRIGYRGYTTEDIVDKGQGAITISPSNMKGEYMTFEKCTYISWKKYEESPEIKIRKGDVLMVKTGSTYGKVGIVSNLEEKATINPQILVLKNIIINPDYLFNYLSIPFIQHQIETNVIGSTIPTISQTKVLNFTIVLPSPEEIESIVKYIQNQMEKIDATLEVITKQLDKIGKYRAAIISEAVTGKIDVREWEPRLKETV